MIKRISIAVMLAVAAASGAAAQTTAGDMLVNAPASVMPLLPRNTRLDMIDYFKSSLPNASANLMQGKSRVTALTPDNVELEMSSASTYQLALLPAGKDTVAVLIETVATPVRDSAVRFFSKGWNPVARDCFDAPVLADWLSAEGKRRRNEVESAVPFIMASYHYDPATRRLTVTNNMSEYFTADDYAPIEPLLKKQLIYTWNGKRMVLDK